MARPLIWTSNVYNVGNASEIGYVTFPLGSFEVGQAAQQFAAAANYSLKERNCYGTDRITFIRRLAGVPLYGYQGISQYESASVKSLVVGKHIYEGKSYTNDAGEYVTGRDWRYLPSPVPYSLMNDSTCDILKSKADDAVRLYEAGEAMHIIEEADYDRYVIHETEDSFMDQIRHIASEARDGSNAEKSEAMIRIKTMMENISYKPDPEIIPNYGSPYLSEMNKRLIRIDYFVSAPVLQSKVAAGIAKIEETEQIMQGLRNK